MSDGNGHDDSLRMAMIIQGYEVGREDFGDGLRDRIAFEVAFSHNVGCGSKAALMQVFYMAADAIVEAFNKDQVVWTKITETKPDAIHGCVLFRYHRDGCKGWLVSLAYYEPGEEIDAGQWHTIGRGPKPWPEGSEWMAIPL